MNLNVDKAEVARASASAGVKSAALPFAVAYGATTGLILRLVRWGFYLAFGAAVVSGALQVVLLLFRPGWHQLGVVAGHLVAVTAFGVVYGAAVSLKRQLAPAGTVRVAKVGPVSPRDDVIDVQARDVRPGS